MHRLFRASIAIAASAWLPAFAAAQSFNIDVYDLFGTPTNAFGAAASQPGVWNAVAGDFSTQPLVDLAGGATSATIVVAGNAIDWDTDNPGTAGDDEALMDDISDHSSGPGATWTFSGLQGGNYVLVTYAWAPDDPAFRSRVTVTGSPDGAQDVGGVWPGGYVLLTTHARHTISVGSGGSIVVSIVAAPGGGFASCNGFQLTKLSEAFVQNCLPGSGGVTACPCSNPPAAPGLGCNNFGTGPADSGTLNGTGTPSLSGDTVSLTATGLNNTFTTVFFSGEGALTNGVAHAAGVRCVNVNLKRLYTGPAPAATITRPGAGDPSVSAATAAVGAPISPGQTRHYFVIYRDPNAATPCGNTASTVNLTNSGSLTWYP